MRTRSYRNVLSRLSGMKLIIGFAVYMVKKSKYEIEVAFPLSLSLSRVSITGGSFKIVQKELTSKKYEYYLLQEFT